MKKRTRNHRARFCASGSHLPQKQSRYGLQWVAIIAFCSVALFGLLGIVVTAQARSSSPALIRKQQLATALAASPVVQPVLTRHAEIINMQQGPFLSAIFTVRNVWQGPVANTWVLAYAGGKPNADGTIEQGGIVLYTETVNSHEGFDLHFLGTFLDLNEHTALSIVSFQGTTLTLHSASGHTIEFDLQSHQFQRNTP